MSTFITIRLVLICFGDIRAMLERRSLGGVIYIIYVYYNAYASPGNLWP